MDALDDEGRLRILVGVQAQEGGTLSHDLIAASPEATAAMTAMGQPPSQGTQGIFAGFTLREGLRLVHAIDFIPHTAPHDSVVEVQFSADGEAARVEAALLSAPRPAP